MRISHLFAATASLALVTVPASAQSTGERIGNILGSILGIDNSSIESQWRLGRTAIGNQRADFDTRVDADVRSGRLTAATATRLKADYAELAQLEANYLSDRSLTATERSELTTRYNAVIQVLNDGRYAETVRPEVSEGQTEFNRRVDAQVTARKLSRTNATRLKADYTALVRIEDGYLRDGVLSDTERADLDTRLDALDARVGDVAYATPVTAKSRLDAIFRALPTSGLNATARSQLLIEHGDLVRLEAAYARTTPTAEEKAYLEQRLANLEGRAKVSR